MSCARRCIAVVLAAGEGTRMRSARPKVLHQVAGRAMVAHVVAAVQAAGADAVALVVGPDDVVRVVALVIAQNFVLAGVLFVSMSLASSLATLSGELTPLALQKFGADPALASSIFVTMITDAVSFLLLLGLGSMVVNRL